MEYAIVAMGAMNGKESRYRLISNFQVSIVNYVIRKLCNECATGSLIWTLTIIF